jgi:two-component system, chemotaxis family, chemotaxis protein CheY
MDQQNTSKTVLLVDDDTVFTSGLSERFKTEGVNLQIAVSGKEALEYINTHQVDFIILDFIMPEMDGFEFYHKLKHDMRKNIPTIVLTNLAGAQGSEGLEVYVKSNTDLDSLVNKVKTQLG